MPQSRCSRRFLAGRSVVTFFVGACVFFLCSACALHAPAPSLTSDDVRQVVRRFAAIQQRMLNCPQAISADFQARSYSWSHSLAFTGYLLAQSPFQIKIVSLHPGGQPFSLLSIRDRSFRFVSLADKAVYEGDVASDFFRKTGMVQMDVQHGFYWLTGRLPAGSVVEDTIQATDIPGVARFRIKTAEELYEIDFDFLVERVMAIRSLVADAPWEISYRWSDRTADCRAPASVEFQEGNGTRLELGLSGVIWHRDLPDRMFQTPIPPGFAIKQQ